MTGPADSAWQDIATAPERGEFMAWHPGFGEVRTVRRYNSGNPKPGTVINGPSGKFFVAEWWMPLPNPPPTNEGHRDHWARKVLP